MYSRDERLLAFAIISRYEKHVFSTAEAAITLGHVTCESNVWRSYDIKVRPRESIRRRPLSYSSRGTHERHMCCGDVTIKVIWFDKNKNGLLFWRVAVNIFRFLCVYDTDMRIVLLKWNGETLMKWLRAVLEMLLTQSISGVVCVFMSSLRRHACFSVCVCAKGKCASYQRMWAEHSGEQISKGDQHVTAQQRYCKQEQVQVY